MATFHTQDGQFEGTSAKRVLDSSITTGGDRALGVSLPIEATSLASPRRPVA
ncbi:MAG: hypothetical protein JWL58_1630, partial [Streptosporangiaceae bacterium]|nr:hypothetical protein [Streptosporangiaceae bacterium]